MKTTLLTILVCALAVIPASANWNTQTAQQLSSEARELRTMANDVAAQLKSKQADIAAVEARLEQFTQRAGEINRLVDEMAQSGLTLDARQQREFDRLKMLASLLNVFVDNKKQLIESGNAASQRELLRAHAVGVAARADLIEKTVRKINN
jgi:septal ring factor EnvC (AmiA/AmiB activator)